MPLDQPSGALGRDILAQRLRAQLRHGAGKNGADLGGLGYIVSVGNRRAQQLMASRAIALAQRTVGFEQLAIAKPVLLWVFLEKRARAHRQRLKFRRRESIGDAREQKFTEQGHELIDRGHAGRANDEPVSSGDARENLVGIGFTAQSLGHLRGGP